MVRFNFLKNLIAKSLVGLHSSNCNLENCSLFFSSLKLIKDGERFLHMNFKFLKFYLNFSLVKKYKRLASKLKKLQEAIYSEIKAQ